MSHINAFFTSAHLSTIECNPVCHNAGTTLTVRRANEGGKIIDKMAGSGYIVSDSRPSSEYTKANRKSNDDVKVSEEKAISLLEAENKDLFSEIIDCLRLYYESR